MDYIAKYQIEALKVAEKGGKVSVDVRDGKAVLTMNGCDCVVMPQTRLLLDPAKLLTWTSAFELLNATKNKGYAAQITAESRDWYSRKTKRTICLRKVITPEADGVVRLENEVAWFNEKLLKKIPATHWVLHKSMLVGMDADGEIMGGVMAVNVKGLEEATT